MSRQPGAADPAQVRPPATGGRPPSIRDVAAAAGVSHQTVSRVINQAPRVKAETRELVLATIEQLGFRPNRIAQALGTGRSTGLTVVASDITLYGPAATIRGVERAARRAGRSVGIRFLDSSSRADVTDAVLDLSDTNGGVVVVLAFDDAGQEVFHRLPAGVPAVAALDPGAAVPTGRTAFSLDERTAAAAATRYLLELGHRTVHHVAVPSEHPRAGRMAGWRDALRDAGVAEPATARSDWGPAAAREAAIRMLAALPEPPTAILCGNDDAALGVHRALFEIGLRVPEDVSLVGFDDAPSAAVSIPRLTTVTMPFEDLGRALVDAIDGDPVPPRSPQLVVRESTSAPR